MGFFSLKKCRHKSKLPCNKCDSKDKCTVPKVFCDANVIVRSYLEEEEYQIAREFIQLNRKKHRIVITNDVLGEIIWALITDKEIEDDKLRDVILDKFIDEVRNFTVYDSKYAEEAYRGVLDAILGCENLRCGSTDKIDIATAAYHKIKLFTFDGNIKSAEKAVNDALCKQGLNKAGYKFKLYNFP